MKREDIKEMLECIITLGLEGDEAIDYIDKMIKECDEWINVVDKLPLSIDDFHEFKKPIIGSLSKQVLVSDGLNTWETEFSMWFDNSVSGHNFGCIGSPTHWQLLPSPSTK